MANKSGGSSNSDLGYFVGGFVIILVLILSGYFNQDDQNKINIKPKKYYLQNAQYRTLSNRGMTEGNILSSDGLSRGIICDSEKTYVSSSENRTMLLTQNIQITVAKNTGEMLRIINRSHDGLEPIEVLQGWLGDSHYFYDSIIRETYGSIIREVKITSKISQTEWYERLQIIAPNYYQLIDGDKNDCRLKV